MTEHHQDMNRSTLANLPTYTMLACVVACIAFVSSSFTAAESRACASDAASCEQASIILETHWIDEADGNPRVETTTNDPGESNPECMNRHLTRIGKVLKTLGHRPEIGSYIATVYTVNGTRGVFVTTVTEDQYASVDRHVSTCMREWGLS
jgi:hypothetical protein